MKTRSHILKTARSSARFTSPGSPSRSKASGTAAQRMAAKKASLKKAALKKVTTMKAFPAKKTIATPAPLDHGHAYPMMMASGVINAVSKSLSKAAPKKVKTKAAATWKKITVQAVTLGSDRGLSSPNMMASGVINAVSRSRTSSRTVPLTRRRKSLKPRLLWIGDALVPTGFATVTHAVLSHLQQEWDVIVSGVNYEGSRHKLPYQVLPACQDGDMWGMNRFRHLCAEFDPAAVIINNDWWNVAQFARLAPSGTRVIGYMPVDGGCMDPVAVRSLSTLHAAVWYTSYGHREASQAGFKGPRHVIPHGIDTAAFHPMDRDEARRILDLNVPKNAFIVGNLNRNQPRKRLDLTIEIFASWIKQHKVSNAFLLLHCALKDIGWDLRRIAAYHGVADRLLCTGSDDMRDLQSTRHLQLIYNSLDLQMTTTLGEGWGLTTMEGMACGIPQIVPDSSALAEWAAPAMKIPCSRTLWTPEITTIGALVDDAPFVQALHDLYRSKTTRARLAAESIAHVRRKEFQWKTIARQFHEIAMAPAATPSRSRQPMHA